MRAAERADNWDLPEIERAVAAVLGRTRALELSGMVCERFAPPSRGHQNRTPGSKPRGRSGCLYVPKSLDPNKPCRLVELLGHEEAAKMIQTFPGEILWFGACDRLIRNHREEAMRRMRGEGWSLRAIAFSFDVTERTAANVCSGLRRNTAPLG